MEIDETDGNDRHIYGLKKIDEKNTGNINRRER